MRLSKGEIMKTVIFDLDGTIINSERGITGCLRALLSDLGMEQPPQEKLLCFIGPPLEQQLQAVFGFDEEKAKASVTKFRARFDKEGIFECDVYPGVKELICRLKQRGHAVYLASSKHENACVRILKHFELARYFDGIYGSTGMGKDNSKESVLRRLFEETGESRSDAVLVGDTKFDVLGAKAAGIPCVGVTYGFGSEEELALAGAIALCKDAGEVEEYLADGA